jgi:hypothetical protein
MTEVELRALYTLFRVAEGNIPSQAILELMNLSLGSHARAVAYIHDRLMKTIEIRGDDQQGRLSELTCPSGGYDYPPRRVNRRVNHPPDSVAAADYPEVLANHDVDGVAAAGNQAVLAHNDVDGVAAAGNQAVLAHHDVDGVAAAGGIDPS